MCGIALALVESPASAGSHALHAGIVLVVGMIFFGLKMFGGGDVKFYTGIASFFALADAVLLLLCVSLSGLALLAVWFISRRLLKIPIRGKNGTKFDELPYGIAIGVGAIVARIA
jgi:prepilin peptidase CpaA